MAKLKKNQPHKIRTKLGCNACDAEAVPRASLLPGIHGFPQGSRSPTPSASGSPSPSSAADRRAGLCRAFAKAVWVYFGLVHPFGFFVSLLCLSFPPALCMEGWIWERGSRGDMSHQLNVKEQAAPCWFPHYPPLPLSSPHNNY